MVHAANDDYSPCIATRLGYGRSGVRIPVEGRDFCLLQKFQTCSEAYSAPNHWVPDSSPDEKRPGREVSLIHIVPRLRMSGAKPLLPLYVFKAWKGKNIYSIKLLDS